MKNTELKYKTLYEAIDSPVFIVDAETLDLLDANKKAEEVYGYSLIEFKKLKATELSAEPKKTEITIKELNKKKE